MRQCFFYFQSSKDTWFLSARDHYAKKLNRFSAFQVEALKSPSYAREDCKIKRSKESEILLGRIEGDSEVILFDERGKRAESSRQFTDWLNHSLESGKQQIVYVIGGAFGVSEAVRNRANHTYSLSPLVMNHQVAVIVALEQIYRAQCIRNNRPYHNE